MAGLLDHLWQSALFFALICGLAWLTRRNSSQYRLWLWRAAAAKFLLPLSMLVWMGERLGFPVNHSADLPPEVLMHLAQALSAWLAPAAHLGGGWIVAGVLVLLAASAIALHWSWRQIGAEHARTRVEQARAEIDPDDRPPGVSFIVSALMSTCALAVVSAPLISGAIDSQLRHLRLLALNAQQLRDAPIVFTPAKPGQGQRYRLEVDANGVTIRNATLREVMGISFGVTKWAVYGVHFQREGEKDWLIDDRHDVRITGRIIEPENFDTYALRVPMTRKMALQFGIEVHLNGVCQPPCGRWGSYVLPAAARAPAN